MIEQHLQKGIDESLDRFKGLQSSGHYLMAMLITVGSDFDNDVQSFTWKYVYKQGNAVNMVDSADSSALTLDLISAQKSNPVKSLTSKEDLSSILSKIQRHLAVFQIKDQPQPHISKFFQSEHAWLYDVMTENPTHPENLPDLEPKKVVVALYSNFVPGWTSGRYLAELKRNDQLKSQFYRNMFSKKPPEDGYQLEIIYFYQPEHLRKSDVNFLVNVLLSEQIIFQERVRKLNTRSNQHLSQNFDESDGHTSALQNESNITLNPSSKALNQTESVSVSSLGQQASYESKKQKKE